MLQKSFIFIRFHIALDQGQMQDFDQVEQLSNYNSLSGSNSLTNQIIYKIIII
jgi:hypothetical protein